MKRIAITILVAFTFLWISDVSGGNWQGNNFFKKFARSPESTLTCWNGGVQTYSTPEFIDVSQCPHTINSCATCIISLEDQGCRIIDAVVRNPTTSMDSEGKIIYYGDITYLLSCIKP